MSKNFRYREDALYYLYTRMASYSVMLEAISLSASGFRYLCRTKLKLHFGILGRDRSLRFRLACPPVFPGFPGMLDSEISILACLLERALACDGSMAL